MQLIDKIVQSVEAAIAYVITRGQWQRYEGPSSRSLVALLAERVGQSHLQLTSSGTAALEITLRAAGIGAGDEVLIASYDYPGNFWAIERVGARPVLVDTLPGSWGVNLQSLENSFQPSCKALIISHLHGELQTVDELRAWCDKQNVLLIEDICQSLGATWKGSPIGSFGHVAIMSFGGGKLLSCGRGGALATSDEILAIKARVAAGAGSGPYEMSELQAATVLAQLPWLDEINSTCRVFFDALDCEMKQADCGWIFVPRGCLNSTAFYQCGWQIGNAVSEEYRSLLLASLQITQCNLSSKAVFGIGFPGFHRRSARRCRVSEPLTNSTSAANQTLVLHHRVALEQNGTPEQIAKWIIDSIEKIK